MVKNPLANAGDARDAGLIPGLGRSPGEGNGNLLQFSSSNGRLLTVTDGRDHNIVTNVSDEETGS